MSGQPSWISQVGSACALISKLNAGLYHGLRVPRPGDQEWEELVDVTKCRHGWAISPEAVLPKLGLRYQLTDLHPERVTLPLQVSVMMPCYGAHVALMVDLSSDLTATVVNLRRGELVTKLPYSELCSLLCLGLRVGDYLAVSIQPEE